MADKNQEIAKFVMEQVGGEKNVISLVHCATRLRFQLKDDSIVNEDALKNNPNILTAQAKSGQYQVVIGNNVSKVYDIIMETTDISGAGETDADPSETKEDGRMAAEKKNPISKVFEYISGTFSPLIPALAGSGMIKAILAILAMFSWWDPTSATAAVLNAASNGLFYFFPIFVAISAANFLKVNPYVAGVIAAALMEPSFTALLEAGGDLTFMGLPLIVSDYAQTVFPMLVSIAIYAPLEKFLKKHVPDTVQLFLVPMLGILIMVPLTALIFGPFGQYVSSLIANGLVALLDISSVLTGVVMAVVWPFLVILGVHWGVTPISLDNLSRGGDPLNAMAAAATFAQIGIAFGVFLRYRKNQNLRSLSLSATISGLLAGVTEPTLYGIILRYKRLVPIMMVASGVGGGLIGLFGVKMMSFSFNSLLTIPTYSPTPQYVIAIGTAFILAAVLTYVFGIGKEDEAALATAENGKPDSDNNNVVEEESKKDGEADASVEINESFTKPIKGRTMPLDQVDDPVFSSGAMGQGVAIEPSEGKLYAPADGQVILLADTKHAVGLKTDQGLELLIHIGLDTVELDGKPFETHINQDDYVKRGDLLITIDLDAIKAAGKETVTPVVVTNPDIANEIQVNDKAKDGEDIILVK